MMCAGNLTPVRQGAAVVEFCYEHFELPAAGANPKPAWALHALGLADEMTAAFALVPANQPQAAQWFTARWGRAGVGPASFMPVPSQIEDDRPTIEVHGFKSSNFNWHNTQWEIVERVAPHAFDLPSADGESLDLPANTAAVWAFRDGAPLVSIDDLSLGEHPEFDLHKQTDEANHGTSYQVRFGGRIWRRWLDERPAPLELLAFDTASPVLQQALDHVWADIGGQDDAKRELIRAIQWPVLYPELFLLFKRKRSRGVLLYGPPGCGKTLLGKAVVRLLAALYHRKADDGGFKYVKGHQLLDQYLGNSEKAVKALFDEARRWREQRGYPAVLFFDEADALFKRRASGAAESGFTLVPALLAEMDGMDDSGSFVILATNRPDALDIAITRPGRIDRRIRVTRPDRAAAETIFRIHLEGVFLDDELTAAGLSAVAATELFDPAHLLYEIQFEEDNLPQPFLLKDLASGALIQNIVDRATANKMEFCIEHGVKAGVAPADIRQAVAETLAEQRQCRHAEELEDFAEQAGRRLVSVRKILPQ
jgi:hypothetical protein